MACALDSDGCEVSVGSAIIDNACTTTILGKNAIPFIRERWFDVPATVMTANGKSNVIEKGSVMTVYGLISGYIVEESDFSLWSLDEALRSRVGGRYVQTLHDAYIQFSNGSVINFEKEGRLWVIYLYDNDYVPSTFEELNGHLEMPYDTVQALAAKTQNDRKSIHAIQGHSIHDPDCEHCLMGRMRVRARRRVGVG